MKSTLITLLCIICTCTAFSQAGNNPPENIRQSFHREYPQSQPSQWNHSKEGWSVNFEDRDHNDGQVIAHFDHNGRHMDTHIRYDGNDVPSPVINNVRRQYPGSDNYEFTRIDRRDRNDVYKVRLRHRQRYRTVYMDHHGRVTSYHGRNY